MKKGRNKKNINLYLNVKNIERLKKQNPFMSVSSMVNKILEDYLNE